MSGWGGGGESSDSTESVKLLTTWGGYVLRKGVGTVYEEDWKKRRCRRRKACVRREGVGTVKV